jgi:hypothetical protein
MACFFYQIKTNMGYKHDTFIQQFYGIMSKQEMKAKVKNCKYLWIKNLGRKDDI